MSNEIGCDVCKKEATVHLTQIINGKVHKVDLCEACAQNLGVTDPNGFSVSDLLAKDLLKDIETEQGSGPGDRCPDCGCTKQQFRKSGRFGCPTCYETFAGVLLPILKTIHSGVEHTGKIPQHNLNRKHTTDTIRQLESELRGAVAREDYETAASLRDQLADIRDKATGASSSSSPES